MGSFSFNSYKMRKGNRWYVPRRFQTQTFGKHLSALHALLSSPTCERPRTKSNTTICCHGPISSTHLEISVPSKPTHFNEPWPTGMTESFSHVKCCHSWSWAAAVATSPGHHPVSSHNHMDPKCRAQFSSSMQSPGETGLSREQGAMAV